MNKIKDWCLHSATITWGYILAFSGVLFTVIDQAADVLNLPDVKQWVTDAVGDPKLVGRILLGVSVITIIARVRSIRKNA